MSTRQGPEAQGDGDGSRSDIDRVTHAVVQRGGKATHGDEWRFPCPHPDRHSNGDRNPSADWNPKKGVWCCRVCGEGGGCVDLGRRLGVDLGPEVVPPDLEVFAAERKIPIETLREFGVHPTVYRGRPALRFPTAIGPDRIKYVDDHRPKYEWAAKGGEPHWYGLDQAIPRLRDGDVLYITNGEPSVWACASRRVAATCLSAGEGTAPRDRLVKELKERLQVVGDVRVGVVFDVDAPGRTGSRRWAKALKAAGCSDVVALDLEEALPGIPGGDVDDLHREAGEGLAAALADLPELSSDLPSIQISGRLHREIAAEAIGALLIANSPPQLFRHAASLARVRSDERDRAFIERVGEAILRYRLARVADWTRSNLRGEEVSIAPPSAIVQDILASEVWPFPAIDAVTEVPVLRPDGTVFDTPGYDAGLRLVYRPDPKLTIPPIPCAPTQADVGAALDVLLDLIANFPFVDEASRANTLALVLTPVLRRAITGPVPLALVDKPKRGTGASLLVQLLLMIATGAATDLMTMPRDDEELRKKITAALVDGRTVLFFDNVEIQITSSHLAAALTAPEWSDRILGRTEMAKIPLWVTWIATGNNLSVGGDIGRRCYWIRMDAGVARPWQRDGFRHPHLIEHASKHRGEILAAALTVVRGWFAAGRPPASVPKIGSFESWAETLAGVLAHAGVAGFLANLEDLYDRIDDEEVSWETFLSAWHVAYGSREMTVKKITEDLRPNGTPQPPVIVALREALPPDLAEALASPGATDFRRKFGKQLAQRDGTVFGDWKVERSKKDKQAKSKRSNTWRVVTSASETPVGGFGGVGGVGLVPGTAAGGGDQGQPGGGPVNSAKTNPPNPETPCPGTSRSLSSIDSSLDPPSERGLPPKDDPRWSLAEEFGAWLSGQLTRTTIAAAAKRLVAKDKELAQGAAEQLCRDFQGLWWRIVEESDEATGETVMVLIPISDGEV